MWKWDSFLGGIELYQLCRWGNEENNSKQCFACFLFLFCLLCHLCLCFLSKVRCHSCCLAKVVCHYCFLSKVSCHSCICEKGRWAPGWKTLRTRFRQNCIWRNKEIFPRKQKEVNNFSGIGNLFDIVRLPDGLLMFDVWPPWGGFLSNSCQPSFSALLGCAFLSTLDLSQILFISKPIPFLQTLLFLSQSNKIVCNWKWLLK